MTGPRHPTEISGWPQAVVAVAGIMSGVAGVVLLYRAGAPIEAIIGLASIAGGLFTGQFVTARRTTEVARATEAQNDALATISHQVNGGLKTTVAAAVSDGIATGVEQSLSTGDIERNR